MCQNAIIGLIFKLLYPLKFFVYVFIKIATKLPFLVQVPNFREKKHFWTHVTIGSCCALVREDVQKNSEISTM